VVLDGIPSDFPLDLDLVQRDLDKRKPGTSKLVSGRKEPDQLKVLSGLYEGRTTGAPLTFTFQNSDAQKDDYEKIRELFRPGHADFTYRQKYRNRDPYGGGRSSARETIGRVVAGSVASQYLAKWGIRVQGRVSRVGSVLEDQEKMMQEVLLAKQDGDSIGGQVEVQATGVPAGVGEPIYEKLDARLAYALMSINAVKAVEIGDGVEVVAKRGSRNNDQMGSEGFKTNHCGGILGGISTGEPIIARITLKPTPSIFKTQETLSTSGEEAEIQLRGRHDPCVAYRAVVVAEAMMAQVLLDMILMSRALQGNQQKFFLESEEEASQRESI
jgi:chorismate synthase